MIKELFTKTLTYIKKNKVTTAILVISIICLIISLAVCFPIPGKLKLVIKEFQYGHTYLYIFEYKYTNSTPIATNMLVIICQNATSLSVDYNHGYIKKGDIIPLRILTDEQNLSTVYLYCGDRVLAKS